MIELKLDDEDQSVAQPVVAPETQPKLIASVVPSKKKTELIPLVVAFVFGALLSFVAMRESGLDDRKSDDQKQVEPDRKSDDKRSDDIKIHAAGSTFVFVYEFQTKTADQELLLRDMPAWTALNKCGFRQYDQDSKEAEVYKVAAEKAGLKSPFMAVVSDKKISRVVGFPRDRLTLEGMIVK